MAPFQPHVFRDHERDVLECLEKDVSVREESEPGSSIVVLRDNATGKIIGVRIEKFSAFPFFDTP